MAEDKINIRELSFEELQEHLSKLKQQAFRSKQVFEWLWKKNAHTFEEMSNLSIELRSVLDANFFIDAISVQDEQISKDKTIKCAFEIAEGKIVEGVLILEKISELVVRICKGCLVFQSAFGFWLKYTTYVCAWYPHGIHVMAIILCAIIPCTTIVIVCATLLERLFWGFLFTC